MTGAEGRDWNDGEALPFAEDDGLLPWLGTDEPLEEQATAGKRGTLLFVLAAAVLATLVAGYWMSNRGESSPVAGATSKTKPERAPIETHKDVDGITLPDQGRTPPFVTIRPTPDARATTGRATVPITPEAKSGKEPNRAGVQIGAYGSSRLAELGWKTLSEGHQALQGRPHRVVEAIVDGKTVYRLQVVAPDPSGARELCHDLKADGADCLIWP